MTIALTSAAFGQQPDSIQDASIMLDASSAEHSIASQPRNYLLGDWQGVRSFLAENGANFDLRYTSTYQGLTSGTGVKEYEYGGKLDAFVSFDSAKLGLWEGGGLRTHLEYSHGPAPTNLGGALFAANTALFWPVDTSEELIATSLYFTQDLGKSSSIAIGKFNPVDLLAADPFYGGWGIDRFMNLAFVAPPSGVVPVVFIGAIASLKTAPVAWTLMLFDPNDRTNDYLPSDLFEDGVNISLNGSHITTLAGRRTTYSITGIYSTAEGTDYSTLPPNFETTTKEGSYNVAFEFKHNLQEDPKQTNAGWGFYLKVATADGNPNYVQSSVIAGIGGRALFFARPQDSFGIGLYRYNFSDVLQNALYPGTKFKDESAIEAFYSYAITPWFYAGADVQYVKPAAGSFDNALITGLRTQIRF